MYTDTLKWTQENYLVSEEYNVDLVAYEGGPHVVATGSNIDNSALSEKLIAASRNPRMKDIVLQMFEAWYNNGGKLFVGYSFIDNPSKYGTFSILEYQDQPISEAPKYAAYYDYITSNGSVVDTLKPRKPYNLRIK